MNQIERDANDLKKFGYVQELLREMGGFSSFALSFSVISILTGATQLFGYGLAHGGPLQMTAGWCFVAFFTIMVSLSMAELSSSYPTAGAMYHWSHILGGRTFGWFTAALNTIGQFAIMAGIDYGLAQFTIGLWGLPNTRAVTFGLFGSFLFSHAILNHWGIRIVAILNDFSAWYHIVVVLILVGVIFALVPLQPVPFLWKFHHTDNYAPPYSFLVGLLLAQWTLSGYDASAHVTEETVDPRHRTPWAIFLAVAISVIAGLVMLAVVTLAIPDLPQATGFGDNAFFEVLKLRLGERLSFWMVGFVAGAMWLCGLGAMTSASRMVYAFARDHGLPFSTFWAKVSAKHRTPANAIWGLSACAMLLTVWVNLYSAVLSIATIALYVSYGLPIIARLVHRLRGKEDVIGPWNLGSWSTVVAFISVLWVIFISTIFVLPPNNQAGTVMGILCLILIGLWVFVVNKRFVGPKF